MGYIRVIASYIPLILTFDPNFQRDIQALPSLKLRFSHLHNGWLVQTIRLPFGMPSIFRCENVCFREGKMLVEPFSIIIAFRNSDSDAFFFGGLT